MSYTVTDDEAFRAWYEAEFGLPFNESDPRLAGYFSAFTAGQVHELSRMREYEARRKQHDG